MNRELKPGKGEAESRILASATSLFARFGYNGVSIRDIAANACVNEVTIYRHYPRKRDLYVAVLSAELQQVKLRGDLLARIAEAADAKTVLARTFELISATLMQRPEFVRLIQYTALELGEEIDPLVRLHLGELVQVIVRYLEPWMSRGELRGGNTKTLVLSLVAILLTHTSFQRLFASDGADAEAMFNAFADSVALP